MGLLFTPCSQKPGIIWLPVSGEIFPVQHMKMPFTVLLTLYHLQSEIEWNYSLQTSCCDLDSVFLFTLQQQAALETKINPSCGVSFITL